MIKLISRVLLLNLILTIFIFIQGYWYWLINFELAFFSALFIILGSFHGYKSLVTKRLETGEGMNDVMLEKIEDPYELYDEETEEKIDEEKSLLQLVKEEKQRLKKNKQTFKKTIKSTPGIFSPWRFLPYTMLVLSFIGLNNNHILDITGFLTGLSFGIVAAIFVGKSWIKASAS